MIHKIEDFLKLGRNIPIIDVRTPAEFEQGHIPGAYNIPLFSNEERAVIGTIYKQDSKENAIMEGLKIVGPKMYDYVKMAKDIAVDNQILVHCWR
ncbi:MAG: tRNA 2-selenouridine(34) synthase MnmH, partial [Bacteroidetes bacterium]